jgi:hypothetical protein
MLRSRSAVSSGLRSGHSLLLAVLILAAVLLGMPGRHDRQELMAQTPPMPPAPGARPAAARAPFPIPTEFEGIDLSRQTAPVANAKSTGCLSCHRGQHEPHGQPDTVRLGCVDCHGGNPQASEERQAHVWPRFPDAWGTTGNPVRSYTLLNHESPEFIRFVNPGDLRVAHLSCGTTNCHADQVLQVRKSMMTHGAMLWGAALYNNGAVPFKWGRFGESYSMNGAPQRLQTVPPPTPFEMAIKGVVPFLDPLPRYEASQPGNVLRIFERGRRDLQEVGIPNPFELPGKPQAGLSSRGLGTRNRTDPVFLSLQKTRLFDPTLNFLGTNDHSGDYRSSGCTACHMIYANDRSPVNSGPYARFGHQGLSFQADPTIPRNETGHPIQHQLTTAIPTSQCIVCHVHPGTNVLNSYTGYMWWDEETDGELMYPSRQKYPTAEEFSESILSNPDETAARGNWSDPAFLERVAELNPQARHTQFADFHGHGWVFRAVFKKDRHGTLLDHRGEKVKDESTAALMAAVRLPAELKERYRTANAKAEQQKAFDRAESRRDRLPVHQMDIHLEKGMHCVDCHFIQDAHGNTKLYGEVRAAIEIQCIDCHGTPVERAKLMTSGPAADTSGTNGRDMRTLRTPFRARRFEKRGDKIIQHSMVESDLEWEITQVVDTIDPKSPHYNKRAHLAKTVRFVGNDMVWGDVPARKECTYAHDNTKMSCIACHSAWNPSCFGCHLPQRANKKMPQLHNEGDVTRNYVSYNFQTLRDDVFMLAHDGDVTGNRIGPARSSCAVHVGSYDANRDSIYVQQQTISGEGMSGIAFSTNVPHTVRGGPPVQHDWKNPKINGIAPNPSAYLPGHSDTKTCTDCHLSKGDDNNAMMAQLLMEGTNFVNFIGRYCWVAAGDQGLAAVVVTERDEPQAVIGSSLHRLAYPDAYNQHIANGGDLVHAYRHSGRDVSEVLRRPEVLSIQARGEYLYAACGESGLRVFDIAFIDHKGFSERIVTARVSPLGQRFFVRTSYATAVAAPTTIAPDPTRTRRAENREQPVHSLYAYIYVTDRDEGLILVPAGTLLDGNPLNNFLGRELTYNPGGILRGARAITFVGTFAYISCDAGLVVVALDDPKNPRVTSVLGDPFLKAPRAVQAQFRYAFACDSEGIKVLDITDLAHPHPVSMLPMRDARNIYLARTYAYVAAGEEGLVIVDIERPTELRVDQVFNAGGRINDLNDVKLGITYVSEFAYLADGKNGLRVVQLTSPETPGNYGFSPRPTPQLVANYKLPQGGRALTISKGVDRDRAVDESGYQIGVFGRVGARPLNAEEQRKLYIHDDRVWRVSDDPRDSVYRWIGPK